MEVAPGIHRIESIPGPRTFSQYLLRGERTLLVDTGVAETPEDVILPYFSSVGLVPADLDFVLNTHADVDHFGGNAAIRERASGAVFCAHAADVAWIEDREHILRERYGWYASHDVDYAPEVKDWLRDALGPDWRTSSRARCTRTPGNSSPRDRLRRFPGARPGRLPRGR